MVDYGKKGYKIAVFALVLALLAFSVGGNTTTSTNISTTNNTLGLNIVVNNTNLAPTFPGESTGTGQRVTGTTYFNNNSDMELFVISHGSSTANTSEIHLFINGTKVADTSGKPLAIAEQNNRSIVAIIPRSSAYMLEFHNYHHYEWREYLVLSGNITSNITDDDAAYVLKSGDTMTGNLNMTENNILYPSRVGGLETKTAYTLYNYSIPRIVSISRLDDNNYSSIEQHYNYIDITTYNNLIPQSELYINGGLEYFYLGVKKYNISSNAGYNTTLEMNNNNITDTNTLTINNGITMYSPPTTSGNVTYDFNTCTIGTVPSGWVEDLTHGLFRCVSGGKVQLTHNSTQTIVNNNYHTSTVVTADGVFSLGLDETQNLAGNDDLIVISDIASVGSIKGIWLGFHTGTLEYYASGWHLIQAWNTSQTYNITINDTKISTSTFDIWVDGVKKGNDLSFASAITNISYINLAGSGSITSNITYDNVAITTGPGGSSEPWCVRVSGAGSLYTTSGVC